MGFRLVPKSATLNDLVRRNSPYYVISQNSRSMTSQWLRIDL